MRQFKLTFEIDSVITFEEDFTIEEIKFYSKNNTLYAEILVNEEDVMLAQQKAWERIKSVCSPISYIYRRTLNYKIHQINEINNKSFNGCTMQSFEAKLIVRKKMTLDKIEKITRISNIMYENEDVMKVLSLVNRDDFGTWFNLYKVYELIDQKKGIIYKKNWMSRKQLNLFTRTANHPVAGGFEARHLLDKTEPPENPMELKEATELFYDVIEQWINYLSDKQMTS
ncbi:hypothetical protein [Bacillus cereus]|uniref:Uncharacterized protein n=1 Tax=Bacillus cereus TaxID=1396 RepID=A0A0G8EYM2_BACCE|nr:hypothetical protein [Bacillus cereus]KLA29234.1 hypothetical protein B4077_0833 [Bacillus cereus]